MSAQRDVSAIVADLRGPTDWIEEVVRCEAADALEALQAEVRELRLAILDIDHHATPLGEDDDGFVSVGYAISVGCLHRALGIVGHSATRPCPTCKGTERVGGWTGILGGELRSCPDCTPRTGKVSWEALVRLWEAVHGESERLDACDYGHCDGEWRTLTHLRGIQ